MSDHQSKTAPEAQQPPCPAETFKAWDREAERLLAEADAADRRGEDADPLWQAAMAVSRQILSTPGEGLAVATLKLHWLTHPEVGVTAPPVTMHPADIAGIVTVRDALRAEPSADREEWDKAAAAVMAEYAREDDEQDFDALVAAIDRLLTLTPPDLDGLRLLFEVITTETQVLGTRAVHDHEHGPEPLTDERLIDSAGWPEHQPCVFAQPGKGVMAGLAHLRSVLDRMTGRAGAPWDAEEGKGG